MTFLESGPHTPDPGEATPYALAAGGSLRTNARTAGGFGLGTRRDARLVRRLHDRAAMTGAAMALVIGVSWPASVTYLASVTTAI